MRCNYFLLLFFGLQTVCVYGQKKIPLTDHFVVEGKVKRSISVSLSMLDQFLVFKKDSILITNHLLESRSMLKNVRLVRLKDVISDLEIDTPSPKQLSEYYFVCIASDNYKVVFSWNELFNSPTGNEVFLIIGYDNKVGKNMENRIALISPKDLATGRRYVKGLSKLVVDKVQ